MKNQDILQNFLVSYIYIYFAEKTDRSAWYLSPKTRHNLWNGTYTFTCDILYYIVEGAFELHIGKTVHRVQAHQFVYIPAGTEFERIIIESEVLVKYYTHVDLSFGHNKLCDIFDFPIICTIQDTETTEQLFENLRTARRNNTLHSALAANAALLQLICFFLEQSGASPILIPKKDPSLQSTIDYINKNLNRNLTIRELAALSGYSTAHFSRKFKKQFGRLPLDYIAEIKVTYARKRLRDTDFSISAIAEELGYDNPGYFSNLFKKEVGVTPTAYRKNKMWKI